MATRGKDDVLLFGDECGIKLAPTLTRCWALKGDQPQILTQGGHKCTNVLGAVDPLKGCVHSALMDHLTHVEFQTFLETLIDHYTGPGKIILVLDNARFHHAKALQPFLDHVKSKLELLFLPPYSPDLNPIERFWKFLRKIVTHNTFYETVEKLVISLKCFLQKFLCPSPEIISLCGTF
jgi:transposase